MLNRIVIMGRLTRDPELRRTQNGTAVTSFSVAVDRDREGRHRRAVLRAAQLGITGESAHDDDTVQHSAALLIRPCRRSWSG